MVIFLNTALLVYLAFGLAMDAFAVSLTNGMCYRTGALKNALATGTAFGLSQGLMPLLGYYAGATFSAVIAGIDHWIALALLGVIGGKMIVEAVKERKAPAAHTLKAFSIKTLTLQSIATSIDALAVGVGLGVMQVDIVAAAAIIAVVTFLCCFAGVLIGKRFGSRFRDKAEILGGVILILIGLHIVFEHLHHGFL